MEKVNKLNITYENASDASNAAGQTHTFFVASQYYIMLVTTHFPHSSCADHLDPGLCYAVCHDVIYIQFFS